jgi:dihydroxyacetone kinase-like protein
VSNSLTVADVLQILISLAEDLESAKDHLNELDAAIGDGDMGISMARGFRSVREGLKDPPQDIRQILMKVGLILSNSAASTAGALLSTAFVRAAKEVQNPAEVTLTDVVRMVKAAEVGIQERGKAQLGDKTMLDAIVPARQALEKAAEEGASLLGALEQAAAAAEEGVSSTTQMRSAVGRASWLGERTIGHPDPGATAIALMLRSIVESVGRLTQ